MDIEAIERAVVRQACDRVPDIQSLVEQPNISLYANTTNLYRREQRNPSPIIIVRMTRQGNDAPRKVCRPRRQACTDVPWEAPRFYNAMYTIRKDEYDETADEVEELYYPTTKEVSMCSTRGFS